MHASKDKYVTHICPVMFASSCTVPRLASAKTCIFQKHTHQSLKSHIIGGLLLQDVVIQLLSLSFITTALKVHGLWGDISRILVQDVACILVGSYGSVLAFERSALRASLAGHCLTTRCHVKILCIHLPNVCFPLPADQHVHTCIE